MKKGWGVAIGLLAAAALVIGVMTSGTPPVKVSVSEVMPGDFEQISEVSGEARVSEMYTVMPSVSGRVAQVYVSEGESVSKGDKLFSFDDTDAKSLIQQYKYELEAALAAQSAAATEQAAAMREAEAVAVMAQLPSVQEQQKAYEQAAKAQSYEEVMREVIAQAQGGGVDLGLLNKAVEAANMLKALAPQEDIETPTAEAAGYTQLGDAVAVSGDGAQTLEQAEMERVKGLAANVADGPEVLLCREKVRQAEASIGKLTMSSEINGTVLGVSLRQGEIAAAGTPAIVIGDTSELVISLHVPEYELKSIQVGQRVRLVSNGVSGTGTVTKQGTTLSSGDYGEVYGSVDVRPDKDFSPLLGASVDAEIILDRSNDTLYVLRECVVFEDEDAFVYACEEGKAVKKPVETGLESDYYIELCSGVIAGEVLVIAPFELEDGGAVEFEL